VDQAGHASVLERVCKNRKPGFLFHIAPENPLADIFDSPIPRLDVPKEGGVILDPFCNKHRGLLRCKGTYL
jgi:hypothetical protein